MIKRIYSKLKRILFKEPKLLVLLYHKIHDEENSFDNLSVSSKNYEQHLSVLTKYRVYKDFSEWKEVGETGVLLTFDDGYYNNLSTALPLNDKYEIPFTLFVAPKYFYNKREFWWDSLVFLFESLIFNKQLNLEEAKEEYKRKSIELMSLASLKQIEFELDGLFNKYSVIRPYRGSLRPLIVDELRTISKNEFVSIGSHTIEHTRLSLVSDEEQKVAIIDSKKSIEQLINKDVECFSYPHGGKTAFNDTSVELVKKAGYKVAYTASSGIVKKGVNPFLIPRVHIGNMDGVQFEKKIKSFLK